MAPLFLRPAQAGAVLIFAFFAAPLACLQADPALAVNSHAAGLKPLHDFSSVKLRGYGTVSGHAWSDGAGGSLLEIDCQDAEHARLVQAKYLSDLGELPPGTQPGVITVNGARITIQTADNAGAVAALRAGTTVVLAAAPSGDALGKLVTADVKGTAAQWTSVPEGKVPMFLDRFDKYGFRWYYAPGNFPPKPDGHGDDTYDVQDDFTWMQSMHTGLTVWTNGAWGVTPEWLSVEPRWEWALGEAKEKGLAFGVNLGLDGAAYWYFNRNPDAMMPFVPDFLGTYYGSMNFGIPSFVSWCSPIGQDTLLAQLQRQVKNNAPVENITSWLEPHEELGGGIADMLDEYGPSADASFREYLQGHYQSLGAVSQRYDNDPAALKSWNDIHAPEPAEFLGWSSDALDLAGTWKISYDQADNADALGATFDDSSWGEMEGPGHGLARLLPQKPAIWRRHFNLDSGWQGNHQAIWLYVFDLNDTRAGKDDPSQCVVVSLNGKTLPEDPPNYSQDHWNAYDVTQAVQAGDNVLAVRLPRGLFNYRVYLSGDEPKSFPQMDGGKNALWGDFIDWLSWLRGKSVGRGMQMIRQVDPDRGIVLMAPDTYQDVILQDAIAYGGDFHNTGYMGGWWCDRLPALVRSVGLPFSTEPSQGPTLPQHIMGEMGNWICEGVNAIDHFQTLGEVLYHPDLKKTFEDHVALYTAVGRWHSPTAQIAVIYSNRLNNLFGWPFNARPATDQGEPYFRGCGYPSGFNIRGAFSPMESNPPGRQYESDAVDEEMFVHDQVDPAKYHVIVDTDTALIDDNAMDGIERYVRAGGVFVTYGDTGRSSSAKPDSWPIARLTGFDVSSLKPDKGTVSIDAAQTLFPMGTAFPGDAFGLRLNASAPDAKSILNWNDGSVAVGLRPLGKGFVVDMGVYALGDRTQMTTFFAGLFKWLKLEPEPATLQGSAPDKIYWRRFVSNNGLFDLWTFRNKSFDAPQQATLQLDDGLRPPWMIDLTTGTRTPVTGGKLPVNLPPGETVQLIVPRANVADSTSEWFTLQRGWWQGTADAGPPFPKPDLKNIVDLTDGWSFQAVDPDQPDATSLLAVMGVDDSAWPKVPFGIFTLPGHPEVRHLVVRRHISVPATWNHGETTLHLPGFRGRSNVYLDGQPQHDAPPMAAGSTHLLAIEITGNNDYLGSEAPAWLSYHPDPPAKQDLTGSWEVSPDDMNWPSSTTIPGPVAAGTHALRAVVVVDRAAEGTTIVLHARQRSSELHGAIVNGTYVVPQARESGDIDLNITPWVQPGRHNEFVLVLGGSAEDINSLSLEFHPKGTYP
jgi:hypothetical protein